MHSFFELSESLDHADIKLVGEVLAPDRMVEALVTVGMAQTGNLVYTTSKLIVNARACCKDDVAEYVEAGGATCVGMINFHFKLNGEHYTCISDWPVIADGKHARQCKVSCATEIIPSHRIREACIYSCAEEGHVSQVLFPFCRRP